MDTSSTREAATKDAVFECADRMALGWRESIIAYPDGNIANSKVRERQSAFIRCLFHDCRVVFRCDGVMLSMNRFGNVVKDGHSVDAGIVLSGGIPLSIGNE